MNLGEESTGLVKQYCRFFSLFRNDIAATLPSATTETEHSADSDSRNCSPEIGPTTKIMACSDNSAPKEVATIEEIS